jgi:hypothetical protein
MRNGMGRQKQFLPAAGCLFIFLVWTGVSMAKDYTNDLKWLHHNGTAWIRFGPAIVGSTKRIDLFVAPRNCEGDTLSVTANDKDFAQVQSWIKMNLEDRFNFSMNSPEYKSECVGTSLLLYNNERGSQDDLLAIIPLTPRMIDTNENGFNVALQMLRSWMTPVKNNR